MTEELKRYKNQIQNTAALCLAIIAVGLIVYLARFNACFYPGTRIEGVDCSGLTSEQAADKLSGTLMNRAVVITDTEGNELIRYTLADFSVGGGVPMEDVEALFLRQHRFGPFGMLSADKEYSLSWLGEEEILPFILAVGDHGNEAPSDAVLRAVSDYEWKIEPSQTGLAPDHASCAGMLAARLQAGELSVGEGPIVAAIPLLTVQPQVTESDARLLSQLAQLEAEAAQRRAAAEEAARLAAEEAARNAAIDAALDIRIVLDFGQGLSYCIGRDALYELCNVTVVDGTASAEYVPERLAGFLDRIIEEIGADGIARKYGVIGRDEYYYHDWEKGFILDRESLYSQVDALLKAWMDGTVTAEYDYISSVRRYYDLYNTFIEISIENQYMWYYKYGQLVVGTPIVTGCVATGDETRKGVFSVAYLEQSTYLSGGSTNTDGWFYVEYWMPFDGNIGLHDAQWVTEFGGDIYLTDGSHGCINTPLEAMREIFYNCERYCTVVVH